MCWNQPDKQGHMAEPSRLEQGGQKGPAVRRSLAWCRNRSVCCSWSVGPPLFRLGVPQQAKRDLWSLQSNRVTGSVQGLKGSLWLGSERIIPYLSAWASSLCGQERRTDLQGGRNGSEWQSLSQLEEKREKSPGWRMTVVQQIAPHRGTADADTEWQTEAGVGGLDLQTVRSGQRPPNSLPGRAAWWGPGLCSAGKEVSRVRDKTEGEGGWRAKFCPQCSSLPGAETPRWEKRKWRLQREVTNLSHPHRTDDWDHPPLNSHLCRGMMSASPLRASPVQISRHLYGKSRRREFWSLGSSVCTEGMCQLVFRSTETTCIQGVGVGTLDHDYLVVAIYVPSILSAVLMEIIKKSLCFGAATILSVMMNSTWLRPPNP